MMNQVTNSEDKFYTTEVGKRYLDLTLKRIARDTETFYIVNEIPTTIPPTPSYEIKWFNFNTRQPVAQPWRSTNFLTQQDINNVVLARVPPGENFLRSDQSIVFTFPAVTIRPANPNFPQFYFNEGGAKDDNLVGDPSAEFLIGHDGNDTINGNDDNDGIYGGKGLDTLTGGAGSDRFILLDADVEIITDFNPNQDFLFLDLGSNQFPGLTPDTFISTDQFHVGTTATTANQRLIYNQGTGALFFDADGTGAASPRQIAQLTAGLPLSPQNLFVFGHTDYLFTLPAPGTPAPTPPGTPAPTPLGTPVNPPGTPVSPVVSPQGTSGNDNLIGSAADDQLLGLGGNDRLMGGDGNDYLKGDTGNDVSFGGAGADIFALERGAGRVRIMDFQDRLDKLGLAPNLKFKQLDVVQRGRNVLISLKNDPLAVLVGMRVNQMTRADFTNIGSL